jgi:hypothetical protein
LLLLGSFEFVGKKIEEFNLETLNFDLDKFGLCFLCFVWIVEMLLSLYILTVLSIRIKIIITQHPPILNLSNIRTSYYIFGVYSTLIKKDN